MDLSRTQQYTDIIHDTISYSGLEGAVISTPIFNRLHHILQSSLVYLTYSSNKVKRFEHSVGTMYLSGEIFYNSIVNFPGSDAENQLINEAKKEIANWFNNIDIEKEKMVNNIILDAYDEKTILNAPVPNCSLYKRYFPKDMSDDSYFAYSVLFQATRLSGLLHDAGHLPYSHVFEYAAKLLYSMVKETEKKNTAQNSFLDIMYDYCEAKKELHEEIGLSLLKQIKLEISSELEENKTHENLFVMAVFYFTDKILRADPIENDLFSDIHKIISGTLDSDRLDYCSRDSLCSGISKYIFPYQRLFSTYRLMNGHMEYDIEPDGNFPERKRILFCPALKSITEIEELLDRRWKIFTQINYHHRVHKHEIIFSEILAHIGYKELKEMKDDIPDIKAGEPLPLNVWSIWALTKLLQKNKRSIDYLIIQLDDGWMDTLLKTIFFRTYEKKYRNKAEVGDKIIWNMFDELISTQKHYYSYFKRSVDFIPFDNKISDAWLTKNNDAISDDESNKLKHKIAINIKEQKDSNTALNFSLNYILSESDTNAVTFYQDVEKAVNAFLREDKALKIRHCLIRPCNFGLGYNLYTPIYLWKNETDIESFTKLSKKMEFLHRKKDLYLPFHLYYLPIGDDKEAIKNSLTILEDKIIEIIIEILSKQCENKK